MIIIIIFISEWRAFERTEINNNICLTMRWFLSFFFCYVYYMLAVAWRFIKFCNFLVADRLVLQVLPFGLARTKYQIHIKSPRYRLNMQNVGYPWFYYMLHLLIHVDAGAHVFVFVCVCIWKSKRESNCQLINGELMMLAGWLAGWQVARWW